MGRKVLGLEISPQALKIAIVKNDRRPELLHCSLLNTETAFSGSGVLSDIDSDISTLALTIKETVAKNSVLFKGVDFLSVCINNPQTVVRPITLPLLPEKELNAAVDYEISQNFPGVTKTHVISFKEYSRSKSEITGIVSFSPRKIIDPYRKLVEALNYKYSYIDVTPNAQEKAFSAFAKNGISDRACFLCDIGGATTQFTIVEKGMVRHSRQIPEGSRAFKDMFCDKLGISPADYESFVGEGLQKSGITDSDLNPIFSMVYSSIVEQIQQTIDFQNNINSSSSIEEIYLIGSGSIFPKLEEYFSSAFGLPTSIIKPIDGINVNQNEFSKTFSAIGAAIRED